MEVGVGVGGGGDFLDGCECAPPRLCIEMEGCYQLRWF